MSSVRKWPELKISPDSQTGYNRQTNANNDFPGHDLGSTHTKLKVQSWRKREVLGLQDLREDVLDNGKRKAWQNGERILFLFDTIGKMDTIKKSLHLPLLIEQDEDGMFIVSCPTFKACHSYGKTVEEGMENIKEVIEMCLQEV